MVARRPYSPPTLTAHGGAAERTRGMAGLSLELINFRPGPFFPVPPGPGGPFGPGGPNG